MTAPASLSEPRFRKLFLLATCTLIQNWAVTLGPAVYSTVLPSMGDELGLSRADLSLPLSAMLLAFAALSPLVGRLMSTLGAAKVFSLGIVLNTMGYLAVAHATTVWQLIVAFLLLIGPGACLAGPITVSTVISRSFHRRRGLALGVVNMPLLLLIGPPATAQIYLRFGREWLFTSLATSFIALLLLIASARWMGGIDNVGNAPAARVTGNLRPILRRREFWILSLSIGAFTGAGNALATHIVGVGLSAGLTFGSAAMLSSAFGLGTIVGALLFGSLIDAIGALRTLFLALASQALLWATLGLDGSFAVMLLLTFLIGCGMGTIVSLHAASVVELFSITMLPVVMGSSYVAKVPFNLIWPPLTGYIYDVTSRYTFAFFLTAALLALACLGIGGLSVQKARKGGARSPR